MGIKLWNIGEDRVSTRLRRLTVTVRSKRGYVALLLGTAAEAHRPPVGMDERD